MAFKELKLETMRHNSEMDSMHEIKLQAAFHYKNSDKIIIIYPGYNSNVYGFEDRYLKIADILQKEVGAVFRTENKSSPYFDYSEYVIDNLRDYIDFASENSEYFCGNKNPKIYLVGCSAGASAAASVAHEFDNIKKMLLFAPSNDAGESKIIDGISKYKGDLFLMAGEDDSYYPVSNQIFESAKNVNYKELKLIPKCDHKFSGKNIKKFIETPLNVFIKKIKRI